MKDLSNPNFNPLDDPIYSRGQHIPFSMVAKAAE